MGEGHARKYEQLVHRPFSKPCEKFKDYEIALPWERERERASQSVTLGGFS